jgi:succinoglycan biosynthesis transport protein ExoP
MQPTETYNVSRRALDIEDYIDILRRHKGWIFGPFLFTLVVSVVGGYLWPEQYISKGIIKVEPQQVPESLVQATMSHDMLDRINSMLENVESVNQLTEIITTFNLYLKERSREPLVDVIDEMKNKIHIDPLGQNTNRQVPAFAVSFSYSDRHQAQKVVQELMSRFLNESKRTQSNTTFQSAEFMKDLADTAQKELDGIEDRLAAYKIQNNGRLPEQASNNYSKLQSLETRQQSLATQVNAYSQNKMFVEQQLSLYTKQANEMAQAKSEPVSVAAAAAAAQQQKSARLQRADAEVEGWANTLRQLQQKFTDNYPDVKTAREELATSEKKRDQIIQEEKEEFAKIDTKKDVAPGKPPAASTVASLKDSQDREATIQRMQVNIAQYDNQIEQLNAESKLVKQEINLLQGRLDSVPQSEKEYDDLRRERDIKMAQYEENKKGLAKAQVQKEMENRNEGENLQILDGASLPETATYPNHPLVIAIGAGIGLMLGIVIAGAREMKDTSLKNLKDVRAYTQMAILGSIPLLENDFVVRRRRRLAWLGWTTACLASVVLMAGSVVYYISTKGQ